MLSSQSDNNIKLIVLERLQDLKRQHPKVLQEMVMDILRALSSANLDIRQKALNITLDLVCNRLLESHPSVTACNRLCPSEATCNRL